MMKLFVKSILALIVIAFFIYLLTYLLTFLFQTEVFTLSLLKGTPAAFIIFSYLGLALLGMVAVLLFTRSKRRAAAKNDDLKKG